MVDRPLTWPFGGLSKELSFTGQEELTSVDMQNVRGLDALTQRMRGAQRAGLTKWVSSGPEAVAIKHVGKMTHPQKVGDWSALSTPTTTTPGATEAQTERELSPPSQGQPYDVAIDEQGSRYVLDGNIGIAKYSENLRLTSSPKLVGSKGGTWTFPLDREDGDHVLRTLDVDPYGGAYAAVTEGGNPITSRIWCVESDPEVMRSTGDDVPRLRWQIQVNEEDPRGEPYGYGHVGQLRWKNNLLYTVQNNPRTRKSWCVVYELLNSSNPIVQRAFEIPHPAHGIAVKDNGEVLVACPPDANRGVEAPLHPDTPKPAFAGMWNPEDDLTDYTERIWCWLSADLPLPDGSDPLVTINDANTGEERVIQWRDRSGKDRHLFRDTIDGRGTPYIKKTGIGGRRGVEFRGAEALISLANNVTLKAQADFQKTTLPGYEGAAFALCMVVEMKSGSVEAQAIMGSFNEGPVSPTTTTERFDRVVLTNREDALFLNHPSVAGGVLTAGWLSINEPTTNVAGADPSAGETSGIDAPASAFFDETSKTAIATSVVTDTPVTPHAGVLMYVCDGGLDLTSGENRSMFYWNGIPIDRWNSKEVDHLDHFEVGGYTANAGWHDLEGVIYEIFVLDRRDRDDDTAGVLTAPTYADLTAVASPGGGVGLVYIDNPGSGITNANGTWTTTGGSGSGATGQWVVDSNQLLQVTVTDPGSGYQTQPTINLTGLTGGSAPTVIAYLQDPTSDTELERIIGHFGHYYGLQHLLDPGDGTRMTKRLSNGQTLRNITEEYGAFLHPYRTAAPTATGKVDVNELWNVKGLLVKYSADQDSPVSWVLSDSGGIGYGVEAYPSQVDSDDEETGVQNILSVGPPDGDALDFLIVTDDGTTPTISVSGGFVGDPDNEYMRCAIDEAGTAYIPWLPDTIASAHSVQIQNSTGTSLMAWDSDAGVDNDNQGAYAVAVPPRIPGRLASDKFYEGDLSAANSRAEKFFAALDSRDNANRVNGTGGNTGLDTLNQVLLVDFTENGDPPRRTVFIVGSNANFKRQKPGDSTFTAPTGGAGLLAATADAYYDGTPHLGKYYMVDGIGMFVYDPHAQVDEVKELTATRGTLPKRAQQVYSWNSRLIALSGDDQWAMSARNDPRNWDTEPPVPTSGMAISGALLARGPGSIPDVVNTFVPVTTNIAVAGCDSSIFLFRGDPSVGSIELITDQIGMGWGPSWCMLPEGLIFWIDPQGDAYMMPETGGKPQPMSKDRIGADLRDIDWSTHYYRCVYSPDEDGVRVFRMARNETTATQEHWFWSRRTAAWHKDAFSSTANEPASAMLFDGDDPDDRVLVIGCMDGNLRYIDPSADDDDGQAIDSYVTFGPLGERHTSRYSLFTNLRVLLDPDRDGAVHYQLFVTNDATQIGDPVVSGELQPGYNVVTARKAGSYVYLRLRALDSGSWAFEEAIMDVRAGGMRRMVPR